MTTDEKTDSKMNETEKTETNGQQNANNSTTDIDCNKIMATELCERQHLTQLTTELPQTSAKEENVIIDDRCINVVNSDDNSDNISKRLENETQTECDVHMKNAESLENVSIASTSSTEECVDFKLVYQKTTYDIKFSLNKNILQLKEHIQTLTQIAPSMQKLCFKGNLNDNKTLRDSSIKNGVKVLLIGSSINDVIAVNLTTKEDIKEEKATVSAKEPLCRQKQHKKILDKGKPTDVMPAWKNGPASLPLEPLHGMLNKYGNKVRLTFKLEQDQLWVGTKERTEKLSMMSVRSIVSEPIEGNDEYHIMGIQTGPTEASRIWIYWVPSQFINAIKDTIMGK